MAAMAMLFNDLDPEEKEGGDLRGLFAPDRKTVAELAYLAWVLPYMDGGWITDVSNDNEGNWEPHLKKLAEEGKYEEAVKEAWDGANGDWFQIFEGPMVGPECIPLIRSKQMDLPEDKNKRD